MDKPNITLIGLGLIGSSLGHAFKRAGLAASITGYARSAQTREKALELGFVDRTADSAAEAVADADVVFINIPIGATGAVIEEIAPALKKGAVISDVGSVKKSVIDQVMPHLPDSVAFVPGHPIAGTENRAQSRACQSV